MKGSKTISANDQLKESQRVSLYGNPNLICTSRSTSESEICNIKIGLFQVVKKSDHSRESVHQRVAPHKHDTFDKLLLGCAIVLK